MSNVPLEKIRSEVFNLTPEELIGAVVKKDDFAVINNKIEPTRDLILKLSAVTKTSNINTELVNVTVKGDATIYIFKATITIGEKTTTGHGACSTDELMARRKDTRVEHDAIATAETRALKRAFEEAVGLPFINELIMRLFGGYEKEKEKEQKEQAIPEHHISAQELIEKIREAKAMPRLKNIWEKYKGNLQHYSHEDALRVRQEKERKKEEFHESSN